MPGETQGAESRKDWQAFYEMLTRMWQPMLEGGKGSAAFGKSSPFGVPEPAEMWAHWLEASIPGWQKEKNVPAFPAPWLEMMEQARTKLQTGEIASEDPFNALKEWYEATGEMWSKVIEDAIATEQFTEAISSALESYASFFRMLRQASQTFFNTLQLPTRLDIARLAGLMVNLEEKIDRIEDALEQNVQDPLRTSTENMLRRCEARLEQCESKLEKVLAILEKMDIW